MEFTSLGSAMVDKVKKIWFEGELVDWDKAQVHVLTHSLHYGQSAFEGLRAYKTSRGPAVFRLHEQVPDWDVTSGSVPPVLVSAERIRVLDSTCWAGCTARTC